MKEKNPPKKTKKYTGPVKVIDEKAIEFGITDKEKLFCEYYTNNNDLRGNGVQCYAKAYKMNLAQPGKYNTAKTGASQLLSKPNVLNYIRAIFENDGLNDEVVDGELLFTIRQNADFGSKVAAIKVYNELKGRIKKVEATQMNFQINIEPGKSINLFNESCDS